MLIFSVRELSRVVIFSSRSSNLVRTSDIPANLFIKSAKEANDMIKLKEAIDILNQEWAKMSQDMYSDSSNQQDAPQEKKSTENKKDDNIEDADFEVVDDK